MSGARLSRRTAPAGLQGKGGRASCGCAVRFYDVRMFLESFARSLRTTWISTMGSMRGVSWIAWTLMEKDPVMRV